MDGASYSSGNMTDHSGVGPQNKNSWNFTSLGQTTSKPDNWTSLRTLPRIWNCYVPWIWGLSLHLWPNQSHSCSNPAFRKRKPLIFGTGISYLVLIDSRTGAQQEQGEGGALELFAHLPKEVTERSTWKRERENNENTPLFPAEFLRAALLSSTPRTAGTFVLPAGL